MKILYLVNNAAFFCSHRLPIALEVRKHGYKVALLTGRAGSPLLENSALKLLKRHKFLHYATLFNSGRFDLFCELAGFVQTVLFMAFWRPNIVHCASPKALLYGGIAARLSGCSSVVLAISGMGSLYTGPSSGKNAILRNLYLFLARIAYDHPNRCVIVQNPDDKQFVVKASLARKSDIFEIPGSGVYTDMFPDQPLSSRKKVVLLPARLLYDKGVEEFVKAARSIRSLRNDWEFVLAGTADYDNPSAVPEEEVKSWVDEGIIEWWGHCENMAEVLSQVSIVCLPSYREGMPKSLLEAAAAGCAVITTDAIGCRDAIIPGVTGDLVPVADHAKLANAFLNLMDDEKKRSDYGKAGRLLARRRFDIKAVINQTIHIYEILSNSNSMNSHI